MGLADIDKSSEFADTRSDQREHPAVDLYGAKAQRTIGYMEGALTDIERIAQRPYKTKAELEGALSAVLRYTQMAIKKAGAL